MERENRITDFDELRSQLSVAHTAKAIQEEISRTASMNISKSDMSRKNRNGMSNTSIVIIAAAITVLVLGIAGVFWLMQNPLAGMFADNTSDTAPSTQSTEWTGPTIPNFVGLTYEDVVEADEKDSTISIYRTYADDFSDQYKEGVIMSQTPVSGSKVSQADGILIGVTVSKGAHMRVLPKIENLTVDQVAAELAANGLLATAEYQYNDKVAEDRVVGYKSNEVGDTVEYGTNVTIIVSKGKEEKPTQATQ